MLNFSIVIGCDFIGTILRNSLDCFRMNEPVLGNLFESLLNGMAIAGSWLWDRGGYCCSVGVN